jgi:hypothetical protein
MVFVNLHTESGCRVIRRTRKPGPHVADGGGYIGANARMLVVGDRDARWPMSLAGPGTTWRIGKHLIYLPRPDTCMTLRC